MTTEQYQTGYEEGYQEVWKLVPVEPTQEMLEVPSNAWPADAKVTCGRNARSIPHPPAEQPMATHVVG